MNATAKIYQALLFSWTLLARGVAVLQRCGCDCYIGPETEPIKQSIPAVPFGGGPSQPRYRWALCSLFSCQGHPSAVLYLAKEPALVFGCFLHFCFGQIRRFSPNALIGHFCANSCGAHQVKSSVATAYKLATHEFRGLLDEDPRRAEFEQRQLHAAALP